MLVRLGSLVVLVQLVLSLPQSSKHSYEGYKVIQILHKAETDFKKLLAMETKYELDFWKWPRHSNDTALVNVSPKYLKQFLAELEAIDAKVSSFIEDVQQVLDQNPNERITQHHKKRAVSDRSSGVLLDKFHTHESIHDYLSTIANSQLPHGMSAEIISIGNSYEGRAIELIKLSSASGSNKRSIFIDGGIHAREWIAPATVVFFIENLVYNPSNKQDINTILSHYNIYLLPVVNPDGYEYTDIVRLWRKNRHVNAGTTCLGVDLNRNFPYQWYPSIGGSTDPCSDIYSGTGAASEVETQALANFLHDNGHEFDAYLTLHSYGQMWLYPWGFTSSLPADWRDLDAAGQAGIAAIRGVYHTRYTIGSSTNILYSAAGGSDDFAKGGAGIKYSYTLELRDAGKYGFQMPENAIIPTVTETLEGFLKFALEMYRMENLG